MTILSNKSAFCSFGTLLGYAPGGVAVYSSDYDSASDIEYPKRSAFRHYVDGIYMGYKWQCVEFARRWMYQNCGYIFDDVSMAYEFLTYVQYGILLPIHVYLYRLLVMAVNVTQSPVV